MLITLHLGGFHPTSRWERKWRDLQGKGTGGGCESPLRGAGLGLSLTVPILQTRVESARVSLAFSPGKEDAQHPPCALSPPAESRSTSPHPSSLGFRQGGSVQSSLQRWGGGFTLASPHSQRWWLSLWPSWSAPAAHPERLEGGDSPEHPPSLSAKGDLQRKGSWQPWTSRRELFTFSLFSPPPSNAPRSPSAWPPSGNSSSR